MVGTNGTLCGTLVNDIDYRVVFQLAELYLCW